MKKFSYSSILFSLIICIVDSTPISHTYDVIIIGAGSSGIAATSKLLKNNVDNMVVLEAEDRIGGRIHSVQFGDSFTDLGAEWVYGNENVVYDLANAHNTVEHVDFKNASVRYSNNVDLPNNLINQLMEIEREIYGCQKIEEGINIGDFCTKEFQKRTASLTIPSKFPHLLEDALEHFRHEVMAGEGTFDWHEPSAASDSRDCNLEDNYTWKGKGFKTLLDILLQKYPEDSNALATNKILFNKEVINIHWDQSDDTVKIKCKDDSEYVTKKVIFTPSLGVLKAKMNEMFDPALPEDKKKAIETLGIGAVAKVLLQFSEDWWNKDGKFEVFYLMWEKTVRESLTNFTVNGHVWIIDMLGVVPIKENPKVLSVWFAGSSVPTIETMDEQKLKEGIDFALNHFFGHKYDVSSPVAILRSQWYTNPHFRGTYSFETVESRKKAHRIDDLGKPVKNSNGHEVLLIAGDATCPHNYGTVHGAVHTGFREANRVMKKEYKHH